MSKQDNEKNRFNIILGNSPRDIYAINLLNCIPGKKSDLISIAIYEFMQTYGLLGDEDPKDKVSFLLKNYEYMYSLVHSDVSEAPASLPPVKTVTEKKESIKPTKVKAKEPEEEPSFDIENGDGVKLSDSDKALAEKTMKIFGL